MAEEKPILTEEQRAIVEQSRQYANAELMQAIAQIARVTAIAEYAKGELLESKLSPEEKAGISKTAIKYNSMLPGAKLAAEKIFKKEYNAAEIDKLIEDQKKYTNEELQAGNLQKNPALIGEVNAMKKALIADKMLKPGELKQAGIAEVKAAKVEEIKSKFQNLILGDAVNKHVAEVMSAEYSRGQFGEIAAGAFDIINAKLSPTPEYYKELGRLTNDLQTALVAQGKNHATVYNVINDIEKWAEKEVTNAAGSKGNSPLKERIAKVKAGVEEAVDKGTQVPSTLPAHESVLADRLKTEVILPNLIELEARKQIKEKGAQVPKNKADMDERLIRNDAIHQEIKRLSGSQERFNEILKVAIAQAGEEIAGGKHAAAIKQKKEEIYQGSAKPSENTLAPENLNSHIETEYGKELKRALLRSEVAKHVLNKVSEKYPEMSNSHRDTEALHGILGRDKYATVFAAIGSSLPGGIGGETIDNRRTMSPREDFAKGSADYALALREQINQGMHDKEIADLMGKVDKQFSDKYQGNLIDKTRKELKDVATGSVANADNLKGYLARLKKDYGLGVEVLDPSYRLKDNKTPEEVQKTAEKMNGIIDKSIKEGAALFTAHEAIEGIRFGKIDVEAGINTVKEQLASVKLNYGRLDKSFDPNFARPEFPRRTDNEMKEYIKHAAWEQIVQKEEYRAAKDKEKYSKDKNNELDNLLKGDPSENKGKKTSANPANDKFAALMQGEPPVSKLVAYNPGNLTYNAPRGNAARVSENISFPA